MKTLDVDFDVMDLDFKTSQLELTAQGTPFKMQIKTKSNITGAKLKNVGKRTAQKRPQRSAQ